jgi:selenoprotein W-related protein
MADQLLEEFEQDVEELTFIPSKGGVFEVVVDGSFAYSKRETGRHADYEEVAVAVREIVA